MMRSLTGDWTRDLPHSSYLILKVNKHTYMILDELSFNINVYETSFGNFTKQA